MCNAGCEVDGTLFLDNHIPRGHLFRNTLVLFAKPGGDGWRPRDVRGGDQWAGGPEAQAELDRAAAVAGIRQQAPNVCTVPLCSDKGFAAELKITLSAWK